MRDTCEENLSFMANDLFNKRQRLLKLAEQCRQIADPLRMQALEQEYRTAESDYLQAKTAFAKAMHANKTAA